MLDSADRLDVLRERISTVLVLGTKDVRYGADGTFTAPRTLSDGVMCTNGVFGDPLPGANKHCEIRAASSTASLPPPPSSAWTGPITITQGGTYSGLVCLGRHASRDYRHQRAVTIVNSRIRNLDGGDLIQGVNWQVRDLTLERTFLYGGTGRCSTSRASTGSSFATAPSRRRVG